MWVLNQTAHPILGLGQMFINNFGIIGLKFIMNSLRIIGVALKVGEFWLNHKDRLPTWFAVYQKVLLLQPSSAASEKVIIYSQRYFQ